MVWLVLIGLNSFAGPIVTQYCSYSKTALCQTDGIVDLIGQNRVLSALAFGLTSFEKPDVVGVY